MNDMQEAQWFILIAGFMMVWMTMVMLLIVKVICCGVEREEIYMGGGLWVYKCHTCGIEWRKIKVL